MAKPITHLEQTIAGQVEPVTHLEQVIAEYGGGGGDITSANVTAMTGYEIAEEADAIETTDTLNEAIGKLEKGVSDNETNISSLYDHITFSANSKMYYLQPEQPSNPQDGDIWIG